MKKALLLLFLLPAHFVSGQVDYSDVPLGTTAECKAAEPLVLAAANFVLTKPVDDKSAMGPEQFIMRWMEKTEYTFKLNDKIWKLNKKKQNFRLFSIYMSCMAKFVLENPDKSKDSRAIDIAAFTLLADYISDTSHNVLITPDIQKLLDAKKDGKMEDYVDGK